jgi:hypothetical protein
MTAIVTICGRRFECVPGKNVLNELTEKRRDAEGLIINNAAGAECGDRAVHVSRNVIFTFFSIAGQGSGSCTHTIAPVVAFATCFAILATPAHWLRPSISADERSSTALKQEWVTSLPVTVAAPIALQPIKTAAVEPSAVKEEPKTLESIPVPASFQPDIGVRTSEVGLSLELQSRHRDIGRMDDAEEVQQRLASLGYYFGSVNMPWGQRSREALKAFKRINGLGLDAIWDEKTEAALFSSEAKKSTSFVGVWGEDEDACLTSPAVIRREGARAGDTFCAFGSAKLVEGVWTLATTCSDQRHRWTVQVRLSVAGDRLTWASPRGTQTYTRCRREIVAQLR